MITFTYSHNRGFYSQFHIPMEDLGKGHLDSVLSYIAGKSNQTTEPLRERGMNLQVS